MLQRQRSRRAARLITRPGWATPAGRPGRPSSATHYPTRPGVRPEAARRVRPGPSDSGAPQWGRCPPQCAAPVATAWFAVTRPSRPAVSAVVGGGVSESSSACPSSNAPACRSTLATACPAMAGVGRSSCSWARRLAPFWTGRCGSGSGEPPRVIIFADASALVRS